ncbi:uncharacterized protein LOC143652226 [Tamandua tetradactyla]|uniref:uncharacterized protein LOC143652226 n=1 Tax=Tamandua tetradactyla TaxID=48850 RepID=UPI004053B2FB
MDIEGVRRGEEQVDPEGVKLEDSPSSKIPDIFLKATGWAPSGLEAADVDMLPISEPRPPVQDSGPEAGGWVLRCPQWPEDSRMTEEWGPPAAGPFAPTEIPHASSHGRSRARASRWLPRLGNERDKGPKLSLLKRKLELLLTEPERNKKKKQYVA